MSAAIEVHELTKYYGNTLAIDAEDGLARLMALTVFYTAAGLFIILTGGQSLTPIV